MSANGCETKHWWQTHPWRMVQTNFREIDMDGIDAEAYARSLEDFGATVVTLNAGGILASYESRLSCHIVSTHLTGSSLKEILEACHRRNIRVIARMDFSKISYELYEKNPQWAFRTADGGIVEQNGFVQTCQNSEYQQEKALEILEELLETHPFDGVYCNMSSFIATDYSGNIYGMCTCESCRKGFREAFGMEAPVRLDMKDPVSMRYMGFQMESSRKLRARMTARIKAINPEIAVDKVDYLRTESHTDIGEPVWVYSASSNSRQTAGPSRTMVSDNASVDFMGFRYRECSVSPKVMALRQWQNLANSGNLSLYIMGRLDNHRDTSCLEPTRRVFQFHRKNEGLLSGLRSAAEVLLVAKARQSRSDAESYGWIRALTASHVPFDETKTTGLSSNSLKDRKLVILADANDISPAQVQLLDEFVRNGGLLVASGDSGVKADPSSLECLGIVQKPGRKKCMSTVFALKDEDRELLRRSATAQLIAPGPQILKAEYREGVQKLLCTEAEPLFGPPEVCYPKERNDQPGLTVNVFGKGKGIFIPWFCGSFYHEEGYDNTLNFMQDVLFEVCCMKQIAPSLHPSVELVLARKEGMKAVSLINGSGYFGNSFFDPVPMQDIELELESEPSRAYALNGGNVSIRKEGQRLLLVLDKLEDFEMIVLEEKK